MKASCPIIISLSQRIPKVPFPDQVFTHKHTNRWNVPGSGSCWCGGGPGGLSCPQQETQSRFLHDYTNFPSTTPPPRPTLPWLIMHKIEGEMMAFTCGLLLLPVPQPGVSEREICVQTHSTPLPTNASIRSHDSPKINAGTCGGSAWVSEERRSTPPTPHPKSGV